MNKNIKQFIADKKTPYSEIQDIKVDGDFITFTEKFDMNHPQCPFVSIEIENHEVIDLSQSRTLPKDHFELIYGSI